jgi:hypothetical protein
MNNLLISLYEKGIDTEITLHQTDYMVTLYDRYNAHFLSKGIGDTEDEALAEAISRALLAPTFNGLSRL